MAAPTDLSDLPFQLSAELTPEFDCSVQAVCVIPSSGNIATGSDDGMLRIWRAETAFVGPSCVPFPRPIRILRYISPCAPFPTGGFAVGCLDNNVYLCGDDGNVLRVLSGHSKGVVDLNWTVDGQLLSGSWDGTARVWDIATGSCTSTLKDHENAVCVAGLDNGDIVTGSTGKQNEFQQHVGFCVRIWRAGLCIRVLDDHTNAVRCVMSVPGVGLMSTSNDGTIKLRDYNGNVLATSMNPAPPDRLNSIYRVTTLSYSPLTIATASEDTLVRLMTGPSFHITQELPHPGTPWYVASLPNGDIVTCCNQSGTSSRGHVYVWTRDPARVAEKEVSEKFAVDMCPPESASGSGGTTLGDTSESIKILGPYDRRNEFKGRYDGAIAYFAKSDRTVWLCGWRDAASEWEDVGEVQGVASNETYDVQRMVTLDDTGAALNLKFNFTDDPQTVARNFLAVNGLSVEHLETVRSFVIQERDKEAASRGIVVDTGASIMSAAAEMGRTSKGDTSQSSHFPVRGFQSAATGVKFDKALEKLTELNASALPPLAPAELDAIKQLTDVLQDGRRYHSSTAPKAGVDALSEALLWPASSLLPVLDICRVAVTHPDSAAKLAATVPTMVHALLAAITGSIPASLPVAMLAVRTLANMFTQPPTRAFVLADLNHVLGALKAVVALPNDPLKASASLLAYNVAVYLAQVWAESGATKYRDACESPAKQLLYLISTSALASASDAVSVYRYLAVIGSLVYCDPAGTKATIAAAKTKATVASVAGSHSDPQVLQCANELLHLL